MNCRHKALLIGLILAATAAAGAQPGQPARVRSARAGDRLLLNAADLAGALGFELKVVEPGRLVTFCRDQQEGGLCIPVRLEEGNYGQEDEQLLIAADVVRRALQFRVIESGGRVTVEAIGEKATRDDPRRSPGYNDHWGPGRGFGRGQTLPDIPLVDMAGSEVRFSQFLGKRYILYCWASW